MASSSPLTSKNGALVIAPDDLASGAKCLAARVPLTEAIYPSRITAAPVPTEFGRPRFQFICCSPELGSDLRRCQRQCAQFFRRVEQECDLLIHRNDNEDRPQNDCSDRHLT